MLLLAWRHHVTSKIRYDTSACMLVHSLSNKPGAKKTVPLLAQRYLCPRSSSQRLGNTILRFTRIRNQQQRPK